jgi:ribosomal protein L7/L12
VKYQIPPEVLAAWNRGDEIEAIRELRNATGIGLREAKEVLNAGEYSVSLSPPRSAAELPVAVWGAMARGNKIEAIKLAREATGLSLKEAKDAVERSAAGTTSSAHRAARALAPDEVPRRRINWIGIATLFGLVFVVFMIASKMLRP